MRIEIDNFDAVSKMIVLDDPEDEFFYIELIERRKDNRKLKYNIHGSVLKGTSFMVHSSDELLSLKDKIVKYCNEHNARAYICPNPVSRKKINEAMKYVTFPSESLIDAMMKDGATGVEKEKQKRVFIDIDSSNKEVWEHTRNILRENNIPTELEYVTANGGLHIVIKDISKVENIKEIRKTLLKNNWGNIHFRSRFCLYSNVESQGYKN